MLSGKFKGRMKVALKGMKLRHYNFCLCCKCKLVASLKTFSSPSLFLNYYSLQKARSKTSTPNNALGLKTGQLRTVSCLFRSGWHRVAVNPDRLAVMRQSHKEAGGRGPQFPGRTRSQTPKGRFYRSPWQRTSSHPPPASKGTNDNECEKRMRSVRSDKCKMKIKESRWREVRERVVQDLRGLRVSIGSKKRKKQRQSEKSWTFL